ncbi:putative glutamate receptor [Xylocopa sonorina]|uniref:putative glutamate receptor n=1 Tax=Xylocopa sonorina TaxID=1818115 RepID=UPI00403B12D0
MRELLLIVVIHEFLGTVQSLNGVIWDKKVEDFVPIFSVPEFAAANQEVLDQSREKETYNFQGRTITLVYYEIMNLINTNANGTGITGAIGEIWGILAEQLNFTLETIKKDEYSLGFPNSDGKIHSGLLKYIQNNETDVIPRLQAHVKRLDLCQFTFPFWKTSYRLYIRQEVTHLTSWMIKLFSRKVWYAILFTYLLLSVCSFVSQAIQSEMEHKISNAKLVDHFFYNFGMICGQSYLPNSLSRSSRIVELWLGLFSCLIRTAFGALLISYMTQTTTVPPFTTVKSLLYDTSYNIIVLHGSLPTILFTMSRGPEYDEIMRQHRYIVENTRDDLYNTVCSSKKLYAVILGEDEKKAGGMYICRLKPVGISLFGTWIVSGISWNFKYKRTIDMGILKLYEVGFMNLLKQRWIESKNREIDNPTVIEPIIIDQVYLILLLFSGGLLLSVVILLFENLMFHYKKC